MTRREELGVQIAELIEKSLDLHAEANKVDRKIWLLRQEEMLEQQKE